MDMVWAARAAASTVRARAATAALLAQTASASVDYNNFESAFLISSVGLGRGTVE
jgi:hypothetical protein